MSKLIKWLFLIVFIGLSACNKVSDDKYLTFATSGEYPPFEYKTNGELRGFDIDLAKLIANELGKEAIFEDMQFSTILPALQNGHVDAAIATITVTSDRKQHFGFSEIYYFDGIAAVFKDSSPISTKADLKNKKIACQLGSTMEIWLKKNGFTNQTVAMDNNNQAIEALKAGHVDVVLMDGAQGNIFSKKNLHLSFQIIDTSEDGYAIVTKKDAPLLAQINQAIEKLKKNGDIAMLEEKWLKGELP
jgi:polar amino acid transport system substrate-binding protein